MPPDILQAALSTVRQHYNAYAFHNTSAFMDRKAIEQIGGIIGSVRDKVKTSAETNVPDRFELFLLGPDEKKVTVEPDTRKCHRLYL